MVFDKVTVTYGPHAALRDVTLHIPEKTIFAIIGPANAGKTTLLKCINRTIDFVPAARVRGQVLVRGQDVNRLRRPWFVRLTQRAGEAVCRGWQTVRGEAGERASAAAAPDGGTVRGGFAAGSGESCPGLESQATAGGLGQSCPGLESQATTTAAALRNVYELRRRVGMVFPLPVGLPLSVYDNVAYAPRRAGLYNRHALDALVERCLKQAMLWDEVKDRLHTLGTRLSGGQQQRLTLARALSHRPEILCLDEFSIAIDPVTTMKIEDVLLELKQEMTIVLVTNLVQQAHRLADYTAFFNGGKLVETGPTEEVFSHPKQRLTYDYVTGNVG